ncbi:MAG: pseudaminic acid synthase [Bacteroidales bacterium]
MFNNHHTPTFIIAELSANHNHSFDLAVQTIKAAKKAGADAIKFQTYTPDTITLNSDKEYFKITHGSIWDGVTLYELYKQAYTPWEWHKELFETAKNEGLVCFSSPFDKTAVDFLETLHCPIYKIASFEIHDIPLIEYIASKGKPVIMSIGIATYNEISEAIQACRRMGNNDITILKCTSSYPAPIQEANLLTIPDIAQRFGVRAGLSDHTMETPVAVAAVALGAKVIEKHFILDRNIGGPDASFSMMPHEFTDMVRQIRIVEQALGTVTYDLTPKSAKSRWAARSLFVCEDMKAGDVITEKNVRSIRPSHGLHPRHLPEILGKKVNTDIEKGTPFSWDFIEKEK